MKYKDISIILKFYLGARVSISLFNQTVHHDFSVKWSLSHLDGEYFSSGVRIGKRNINYPVESTRPQKSLENKIPLIVS